MEIKFQATVRKVFIALLAREKDIIFFLSCNRIKQQVQMWLGILRHGFTDQQKQRCLSL